MNDAKSDLLPKLRVIGVLVTEKHSPASLGLRWRATGRLIVFKKTTDMQPHQTPANTFQYHLTARGEFSIKFGGV